MRRLFAIAGLLFAQQMIQRNRFERDLRDHPDPPARWIVKDRRAPGPTISPAPGATNAASAPANPAADGPRGHDSHPVTGGQECDLGQANPRLAVGMLGENGGHDRIPPCFWLTACLHD